jgi:hypothetical protein
MISATSSHPTPGEPVDLAPFAHVRQWIGTERHDLQVVELLLPPDGAWRPTRRPGMDACHIGLEWSEAQTVQQLVVRFAADQPVPPDLRAEYWRKNWPTPAPEQLPGARRGWIGRDDPWHGHWTVARGDRVIEGNVCTITFDPIDLAEINDRKQLEEAEDYLAPFRRTLKVRWAWSGRDAPVVQELHAYSAAVWQERAVDILFAQDSDWSGRAEVAFGYLLGVEALELGASGVVAQDGSWRCNQPTGRIRLHLLTTDAEPDGGSRTIVTVRTQSRSFSFLVSDLDGGPIYVKDYGVLITRSDDPTSLDEVKARCAVASRSIYDRVKGEPEQSLARAMAEIPPLDVTNQDTYAPHYGVYLGLYSVLGVDGGRQEFALRYNGELFMSKLLLKPAGCDLAGLLWPGLDIHFRFGTGDPPDFRLGSHTTHQSLMDGYLPIITSEWDDRELSWTQTAFAALLDGPLTPPEARRGDEDVVAMMRFAVRNTTPGWKRACLWLVVDPREELTLQDGMVIAEGRAVPGAPATRQWRVEPYRRRRLRCAIRAGKGGLRAIQYAEEGAPHAFPTAVLYQVELRPDESDVLDLAFPFVSFGEPADWRKVADLDYTSKLTDVAAYWRRFVAQGGQIELPEALLSDFHKAVRIHVAISADKDPASGLTVVPAATWYYGACGNEACWQITMLDQCGYHVRAVDYLETFLRTQGAIRPDGRYRSAEGAFQGLDLDDGRPVTGLFGYNLDHGCIMECMAAHYRLSRDRAWLERVAPQLIAACDFVIRERQATKEHDQAGQPVPEWGLLPAGHLEDNPEWRHWFSINAHASGGLHAIAEALAEIGHPEAQRLLREAAEYREDIRRAARRAMVKSPVVRLLDGTYIPHIPTHTQVRGRESGWFREAAYGPLHLMDGGIFEPWEEEMTWVLKDLEDNLFVSREWGRPVDLERYWFSHGGVTIQANLMDLGIDYLRRGEVEHALRALFNNFASHLYPHLRVFTEHPVVELGCGQGPFYKASDEAKALLWLRAILLLEEGDQLHLAPGVPRAWFAPGQTFGVNRMATNFGPITYRVESSASQVAAEIEPPDRQPPRQLLLHLRRPRREAIRRVLVNGRPHTDFDPACEVVRVAPSAARIQIEVEYGEGRR